MDATKGPGSGTPTPDAKGQKGWGSIGAAGAAGNAVRHDCGDGKLAQGHASARRRVVRVRVTQADAARAGGAESDEE
jgi:hypothetical protein